MEPYSIEEFSKKIKRSIQILLYLFEAKTGMRASASNISPNTFNTGASVYFEIEVTFETTDPDTGSLSYNLNKVDNVMFNFFSKVVLTPKADFITVSLPPEESDDMVGLFQGLNYDWSGHEGQNNTKAKFGFEYNLFYDEYELYYDN
jgi:hypothetical protein